MFLSNPKAHAIHEAGKGVQGTAIALDIGSTGAQDDAFMMHHGMKVKLTLAMGSSLMFFQHEQV